MITSTVNRYGYLSLLLLLYLAPAAAQNSAPGWSDPEASDFANSMNITASVRYNGEATTTLLDTVAFFIDGELRGLGDPLNVAGVTDGTLHLATVFANNEQDAAVEIRVYHAATDSVYVVDQGLLFDNQAVIGGFEDPYEIRITNGPGGVGNGTLTLADLPEQTTTEGVPFPALDLAPFVTNSSSGAITFELANAQAGITFSVDGTNLLAVADDGFTGQAQVDVIATESANGHLDIKPITYIVEGAFIGPSWTGVPDQVAEEGEDFGPLDLSLFVNVGESTDQVYTFVPVLSPSPIEQRPDLVNPTNFSTAMTLIARVQYTGELQFLDNQDQLAAYVDGELRGVADPTPLNGENLYFLNIGTNGVADEEYTLRFYSGTEQRVFNWPLSATVVSGGQSGAVFDPTVVDLSPITLSVDTDTGMSTAARIAPEINGQLTVDFTVADQEFPEATMATDRVVFTALGASLPVNLLSFTARNRKDAAAVLDWRTEAEIDLSHYAVERSTDGRYFTTISNEPAKSIDGQLRYKFVDQDPLPGLNYYRLKMIDLDGSFTYSPVAAVTMVGPKSGLVLYPNPVVSGGIISFSGPTAGGRLTILDAAGRVVLVKRLEANSQVQLGSLPTGLYHYRLSATGGADSSGKLVIK
ncbi:T9SS type A sorting domain-containing protein [Lewinella sp. 4G2]|uniref:T9SS type A sorting domain-containing protein n=1 Tax=Lewinella sp. 4G2 TaxID=1803372 RepID=UPI0007B4ABB9|nr:T9SS type A sorting domain-containing protein [Lewinella sp. 4G2]OAV45702.1 hypothetical protein A3850_014910 [Lewinella sp. 4G2]